MTPTALLLRTVDLALPSSLPNRPLDSGLLCAMLARVVPEDGC